MIVITTSSHPTYTCIHLHDITHIRTCKIYRKVPYDVWYLANNWAYEIGSRAARMSCLYEDTSEGI